MKKHQHQKVILSIAALALVLALLLPALSARADEIYEPYDSDFYVEHSQDCTYEEELYEINASGGVRMMEDPESDTVIYEFGEIGTRLWIYWIYNNPEGGSWGYTEYYTDGSRYMGWIPMGLLWASYTSDMFYSDYRSEIYEKRNTVSVTSKDETQRVYYFEYPGSTIGGYDEYETEFLKDDPIVTNSEFTDEEGRKWGYVGYYYLDSGWVCLESPDLDVKDLWPSGAPERDKRVRTTYEMIYHEDSSEVREIENSETADSKDTEADSTETLESSAETSEEKTEPVIETIPSKTEESTGPVPPLPGSRVLRWGIVAAVVAVVAVSAGIVLLVILRRKKH